jgi:Ca2+-binding RTX toxin-like protein
VASPYRRGMIRTGLAVALTAVGLSLPTLVLDLAPASAEPATCAGQPVTIDLNAPGHPETRRSAADVIRGTDGNDHIEAGAGADVVCAGAGNDDVRGNRGDDVIYGEDGDDTLEREFGQSEGADRVYGGPGDDYLDSAAPRDRYYGGPGNDLLFDEDCVQSKDCVRGVVRLFGGDGVDWFFTWRRNDVIDGGPGVDRVDYSDVLARFRERVGVTVDLSITGPQDTVRGGLDTLRRIEDVLGTTGPDRLYGNDGPNLLAGIQHQDRLFGRGGDDILYAGNGADFCRGGAGTDAIFDCEDARS